MDYVNLPISFVHSWHEQKAVVMLLSQLSLGIQKMRLGPRLPAFLMPNVLNHLEEKFQLGPIGEVETDMAAMLG